MTMALLFQRWAAEFQNTPMTSPGPVLSRGPAGFLRVAKPHRDFAAGLQARKVHATSVSPVARRGFSIRLRSGRRELSELRRFCTSHRARPC
jgi:hypothetical protein